MTSDTPPLILSEFRNKITNYINTQDTAPPIREEQVKRYRSGQRLCGSILKARP